MTVALPAAALVLPLADIDATAVAAAMSAGIDLHEADGAVWSVQGMGALMVLREYGDVIITDVPHSLLEVLLDWGIGVTDQPLCAMSEVAVIIDCPPLHLTDAVAGRALEEAR